MQSQPMKRVAPSQTAVAVLSGQRQRDQLERLLKERDLTVADLARGSGVGQNVLYNYRNGHTTDLSAATWKALSSYLSVPVGQLMGIPAAREPRPGTITVRVAAQTNVWRAGIDMPLAEQFEAPIVVEAMYRSAGAYGVLVRGAGCDRIYPDGTILVVVPLDQWEGTMRAGLRVILQRIRADEGKVEVSVREIVVQDGVAWLRSDTSDMSAAVPPVKSPWPVLTKPWRHGAEKYMIAGVVVKSMVSEV